MLIGEPGRAGDCGQWHDATATDATPVSALRIDPDLLSEPGAKRRLVTNVTALRSASIDGVLPIADLIERTGDHGPEIWLVMGAAVTPTLTEFDPAGAVCPDAILRDIGQTLLALHRVGLAHRSLSASTVVLGADGRALLAEVGLHAALTDADIDPTLDAAQWAALSRWLSGFDIAGTKAALEYCADLAVQDSLAAGVQALPVVLGRTQLPKAMRDKADVGAAAVPTSAIPVPGELIRFGPGVPQSIEPGTVPAAPGTARPSRRRRRQSWTGALATLAVIAAAAVWWWLGHRGGLTVHEASVTAAPSAVGCDATVDLAAEIATNGRSGVIRYQWRRNDGQVTAELTQAVNSGQHSATVHLRWAIAGNGDFAAVATLNVLSPKVISAAGGFTYHCR